MSDKVLILIAGLFVWYTLRTEREGASSGSLTTPRGTFRIQLPVTLPRITLPGFPEYSGGYPAGGGGGVYDVNADVYAGG